MVGWTIDIFYYQIVYFYLDCYFKIQILDHKVVTTNILITYYDIMMFFCNNKKINFYFIFVHFYIRLSPRFYEFENYFDIEFEEYKAS